MDASHLFTDTVTVATKTGRQLSGDPTYGSQSSMQCRWEEKAKLVVNAQGAEEMAIGKIISGTRIELLSRVWLPGADTADANKSKKPIAIERAATPGGYELFVTWM